MSELSLSIVALMVAALATVATSPLVVRLLQRLSVVDVADHRSSHSGLVLRGGGIAVVAGTAMGIFASSFELVTVSRGLAAAITAALAFGAVGLVDDLRVLPALLRLGAQFALASTFAVLLPGGETAWFLALAAALWLVLFVNAFNFMDGINGISGAVGFLVASSLMLTSLRFGTTELSVASAALAGGSLGFLPVNFPNAKAFLGDVGSYFIGSALAALAVLLLIEGAPPVAVLLPFAVYVADVLTTIARRLRKGENILKSHRDHAYQRLANGGLGHVRTTGLVAALVASLVGLAQIGADQSPATQAALVAVATVCVAGYLVSPQRLVATARHATTSSDAPDGDAGCSNARDLSSEADVDQQSSRAGGN